jgi:hypothetical protein
MNLAPDDWWNNETSDREADGPYTSSDCSDNASNSFETREECNDSEVVSVNGGNNRSREDDDDEIHWYGVWYATSDDYDSDRNDDYCTSEGDCTSKTDDNDNEHTEQDSMQASYTKSYVYT